MRYLALLILTGCTMIASLAGPSEEILPGEEAIIVSEWAICQEKLTELGVERAKTIPWTDFRWRSEAHSFD